MAKIFKFDASRRKGGSTDSERFNQSRGHSGAHGRQPLFTRRGKTVLPSVGSVLRSVGRKFVYTAALMASMACYCLVGPSVSDEATGFILVNGMIAFTLLTTIGGLEMTRVCTHKTRGFVAPLIEGTTSPGLSKKRTGSTTSSVQNLAIDYRIFYKRRYWRWRVFEGVGDHDRQDVGGGSPGICVGGFIN